MLAGGEGAGATLGEVPAGRGTAAGCRGELGEPPLVAEATIAVLTRLAELAGWEQDLLPVAEACLGTLRQAGAAAAAVHQLPDDGSRPRLLACWVAAETVPATADVAGACAAALAGAGAEVGAEQTCPVCAAGGSEAALVLAHGRVLGTLCARWPAGATAGQRELLRLVAAILALAVEGRQSAASLADHDGQRRALLARLTTAQEEERRKIARELHDEASQALTAVMMSLARAEAATASPEERAAAFADTRALTTRALNDLRQVVFDLRPTLLDDLGLLPAARWYLERVGERSGLRVEFQAGPVGRLPAAVETALFRILQEAVTNVVRHATATLVRVAVAVAGQELEMTIEDDGRGFDPTAGVRAGRLGSLGLVGMRERAELIGGTLAIASAPGRGTRIVVTLALDGG